MTTYPAIKDAALVGTYPGHTKSGGGFVWDAVLEYRVWCHPERGAPVLEGNDGDYYYAFETYEEAMEFSKTMAGAEEPLALILQEEYISEPAPGEYVHMKEQRMTEWPVVFLSRPQRNERTIPNFFAADAPANRLDLLRGLV
jgi:putative acetyltransferase